VTHQLRVSDTFGPPTAPPPCHAPTPSPLTLLVQWEKVDNKPAFIVYSVAAFSAIWLSSTVVNALNGLPLVSAAALFRKAWPPPSSLLTA